MWYFAWSSVGDARNGAPAVQVHTALTSTRRTTLNDPCVLFIDHTIVV